MYAGNCTGLSTSKGTYRLAKDMWQVKHLNGLTLVSVHVVSRCHDGSSRIS